MGFPIQFIEKKGRDPVPFFVNLGANASLLAVGGMSVAAISYYALKALGFSKIIASIAAAIPVGIGAFGAAIALASVGAFVVHCLSMVKGRLMNF